MKLAELFEGYDTSKNNREHYDDFAEWKKAVRGAGADYIMPKKGVSVYHANGHDGKCGEFDTEEGEGWLVDKWSKTSKVAETKKDDGPVGVPNPSPDAKKNRKMAQAVVAGYTKHIKTSGFNQTYAGKHRKSMNEGKDAHMKLLSDAIRDNWMSWPVSKIAKEVKRNKNFPFAASMSDDDLEDLVDNAKDHARNQYESMNEGMFVVKSKDGVEKRFPNAASAEAKAWKDSTRKNVKVRAYSDQYWEDKDEASDDRNFITPKSKIRGDDSAASAIQRLAEKDHGNAVMDWTVADKGTMEREDTTCAVAQVRVTFKYDKDDDMGVDGSTSDVQSMLVARDPTKPHRIDFIKYVG